MGGGAHRYARGALSCLCCVSIHNESMGAALLFIIGVMGEGRYVGAGGGGALIDMLVACLCLAGGEGWDEGEARSSTC